MSDERKRILQLLQDGKITIEQADILMAELERRGSRDGLFRNPIGNLGNIDKTRLEDLKQIGSQVSTAVTQSLGEVRRQFEQQLENWNIGPGATTLSASTEVSLPETVKSVAVETRNGRIQVTSWDEPGIRLHIRGQVKSDSLAEAKRTLETSLQADRTDDSYQLTVTESKDGVVGANIDIYVPRQFARLLCKTQNGSVHADTLHATELQIDSVNGSVWVHDANVERLRSTVDSGSIEIQHSVTKNCHSVYAATKNGRITIDGIAKNLHCVGTAKTVNGKIQVTGDSLISEYEDSIRPNHARFEQTGETTEGDSTENHEAHIYCETKNGGIRIRA